jgi:hypothetical protein
MLACVTSGFVAPGVHLGSGSPPVERQELGEANAVDVIVVDAVDIADDVVASVVDVEVRACGPGARIMPPRIAMKAIRKINIFAVVFMVSLTPRVH